MKRLLTIFLLLCVLPCAAFADEPVFTAIVTLSKGAKPTQIAVYATGEANPEDETEAMYRIEYTLPDGTLSAQTLLFPCVGESELVPMLRFVDVNFDGFFDIEALHVEGASNVYSTYFLNSGSNVAFTKEPTLSNLSNYELYPNQRFIINSEHDSYLTGIVTAYRVPEGAARPIRYRVASFLYDDRDATGKTLREVLTEYDDAGNPTVVKDETYAADLEEDAYLPVRESQSDFIWQLLDAEPALTRAVYVNPNGGQHYHTEPHCESISEKYWAGLLCLQRWELNDEQYAGLTPCMVCCPFEMN